MAFRSLVSAVSEQCQEIRQTLSTISYFSTWDPSVIAECCRLSSLSEFPPKEVILGSGTGNSHTVYFILDGVCRMIQYLQVETKTNSRGETKYNLYKPADETLNSDSGSIGYASLLFNEKHKFQKEKITQHDKVNEQADIQPEKIILKDELAEKVFCKEIEMTELIATDSILEDSIRTQGDTNLKQTENLSEEEAKKKGVIYKKDHHLRVLQECQKKLQNIIRMNKEYPTQDRPENVNGYFIQTGFLFKGACFGLKKYTDKNFIMSETRVKCLKIPQRFLLQHNPCNIWNRILLFDSLYQPKEEEILECFETDRKWLKEKKRLTEDIISQKKIPNYTVISDVPYSVRLTDVRYMLYENFK